MRPKKAKPTEKDFELLAEQAQQARTQFFVYLATSAFLLVTVMSITDKQLLLNNSSITLPLLNIGVPPLFVLIIGPLLLVLTYCNLHIHWFRYVEEVKELGLSAEAHRRKLFPIMIYQALYHPKEGFMGVLENSLAELALFVLLVLIQACFALQIFKLQDLVLSSLEWGLFLVSIALTAYWYKKSTHHSWTFYKWARDIFNKVGLWFQNLNSIKKLLTWYQDLNINEKLLTWYRNLNIIDRLLRWDQDLKISPTLKDHSLPICSALLIFLLALSSPFTKTETYETWSLKLWDTYKEWVPHLKVSYEVLSPPLELINTPIVDPFLKRMESKKEVKKDRETQEKHLFEGVYWLDLKGRSLRYADFENAILLKTNLSGADLRWAKLQGANLEQSNLAKANLQNADLGEANLQNANLGEANLQDASLFMASLQNASLSLANLQNANLGEANLQNADLGEANLENVSLFMANLQHASLFMANLENVNLGFVNLQNANLNSANLQNANLNEANLGNADLGFVNLQDADLSEAKLQDADLSYANLKGVYFKVRWDEKTSETFSVYQVGGETLCDAKTLEGAKMDNWLFKKLNTLKACNGKLNGVNDPNYDPNY